MSTPGKYDLTLYRGDSFDARFRFWEDAAKTDPLDLTGATVAAEIRDKPGGTSVVSLDCVITTPNIVDVALTPDMWTGAPMSGAWDLEVTFVDDRVRTLVAGSVKVTADITNSVVARSAAYAR